MDFSINQHLSVPLSYNFTTVKNILTKIYPSELEEIMILTKRLKKNCAEILSDMSWHNSF